MRKIPLTRGKVALVDDDDYAKLVVYKWHAIKSHRGSRLVWYACRSQGVSPRTLLMHRQILGDDCAGVLVDHEDGDGLNNQRINLRPATHRQNVRNSVMYSNNTSGFRGVHWHMGGQKWAARIQINNKSVYLGIYSNPEDAARAYDARAIEVDGPFARLNFPITNKPKGKK